MMASVPAFAASAGSSLDRLDYALEGLLSPSFAVGKVYNDWRYLRILWQSYHKRSGAAAGLKIEATAEEIAQDLVRFCNGEKQGDKKSPESESLLELARDCSTKTKLLMAEIGEALDRLYLSWSSSGRDSSNNSSFQIHLLSPAPLDVSFWPSFVKQLQSNVLRISRIAAEHLGSEHVSVRNRVYSLYDSLKSLEHYIAPLFSHPNFSSPGRVGAEAGATTDDALPSVDACLGHVVSVVLRIANQCCDHWLDCKTGRIQVEKSELTKFVEDLHHEIHPRNPHFMEFHLNFLMAIYRSSHRKDEDVDFVMQFCYYLFNFEGGDFRDEVSSLVTLFVKTNAKLEDRDFVQSFFPELNAVLTEIASLFEANSREGDKLDNSPQCSELLTKICLLKAELLLVVQIHNINSSNKSSSSLSSSSAMLSDWEDIIYECRELPRNLSRYFQNLYHEQIEDGKKMSAFIESIFQEVEFLYQSFRHQEITKSAVKNSLLPLVSKLVIFKEETFLMELLRLKNGGESTFLACGREQIALHLQKLKYISQILLDKRRKDREDVFRSCLYFRKLTSFSYSFSITQDKMIISFSDLLYKVKHLMKAELKEIIPQFLMFDFPKTCKLRFLDFLLTNLEELLKCFPTSIASVKHHIEEIQLHLKLLNTFLVNVTKLDIEKHPELKDIGDCVNDVAYQVECIVDSIEVDAQPQNFFWLIDVLEDLRLVKEKACGIHLPTPEAEVRDSKIVNQVPIDKLSRDSTPTIDEFVVDLKDEEQFIIEKLTRGTPKALDIVSIIGMPGLGKTTLAMKVYNSKSVMYCFHQRAWCTVSQAYEKRRLLIEILTGVHGPTDEIHQMTDDALEEKLRKALLRNKYLIVMDDVWDAGAVNDLKKAFPNDSNGSRILLTSRHRSVALEIEPDSVPHSLRQFSEEESWELLEKKVFKGESYTKELLEVGKEIARRCQGLPLALVAVAGILKAPVKNPKSWKKLADTLSSEVIDNPEAREARCKEVLGVSYNLLPEHLKSCLCYMVVLSEERDILVRKLKRFWLAEGFIPRPEQKSSEEVAEDFLMDLIDRSLVIISKRRSNGKVKSCRLHDLILDFCKSKLKDASLFQLVTRSSEPYASFPSSDYGFEFDFHHNSCPVSFSSYRLAISLKRNHLVESKPIGLGTRSLLFFASSDSEPRCPYDISFIWQNFKLLRVLDFECINVGVSFPAEIGQLVQLRYLAVGGYLRSIPQSISNLRRLETLILKGLRGMIMLPNTIWQMKSLRHVHVNPHISFNRDDEEQRGGCFELKNLVSLSCPSLSCGEEADRIIIRFQNVGKLRCIFFESQDSSTNRNQFPRLIRLTHLESLKILYHGTPLNNGEFNLPLNLKKLTLSNFRLPWSHISTIGKLENLEVLKLLSGAFEGRTWKMEDGEFQKLKFLCLDTLNIVEWIASYEQLPRLQRLVIQNCKELKELPDDLANITSLETIEVHWCGQSAEESANNIREEAGEIKVVIRSSYSKS
ncbi:putative late blight resistance protein homolog R1A-4 [Coffea arabica]|uniref:Late blight resistance protein homolog R1A-4 n=1 Tax=Coffea arabica TaxID=13443 RepID=A0A6P6WWM0_COFAR|nr:putative late blight resistance protein homolog R1A-4 [Coffea arabica]